MAWAAVVAQDVGLADGDTICWACHAPFLFLAVFLGLPALPQQQPDPDSPLFRVTENLVQADAVVTDKSGNVISESHARRFEI